VVEACEAEVTRWESVHRAYRHHLETVSLMYLFNKMGRN